MNHVSLLALPVELLPDPAGHGRHTASNSNTAPAKPQTTKHTLLHMAYLYFYAIDSVCSRYDTLILGLQCNRSRAGRKGPSQVARRWDDAWHSSCTLTLQTLEIFFTVKLLVCFNISSTCGAKWPGRAGRPAACRCSCGYGRLAGIGNFVMIALGLT